MTTTSIDNELAARRSTISDHRYMEPDTSHFLALHIIDEENSVDDCNFSRLSSPLRGWGSADSRRSYSCLKSLSEEDSSSRRRTTLMPKIDGDGWGYFVDTTDGNI